LIVLSLVSILTLPVFGVADEDDTAKELPKDETTAPKAVLAEGTERTTPEKKAPDDKITDLHTEEKNTIEASTDAAPTRPVSDAAVATDSATAAGSTSVSSERTPSGASTEQAEISNEKTLDVASQSVSKVKTRAPSLSSNLDKARSAAPSTGKGPGRTRKMITAGIGVPLCGFAYEGIIEGKGWANTSSDFLWGNIDLRFHFRLSKKFSIGIGLLQTFIRFDDVGLMGGHVVADFRWYAAPDYLYFKMDLFFGFPMFFALGPTIGHSLPITKKVHLFIENQFLFMAVAGVYGFWQPTLGVSTRF
jgi:hypothetical protein